MIQQHFYDQEQIEELNKQITEQNDHTTQQIEQLKIIVNALLHNSGKVSREIYTTNRESLLGLTLMALQFWRVLHKFYYEYFTQT